MAAVTPVDVIQGALAGEQELRGGTYEMYCSAGTPSFEIRLEHIGGPPPETGVTCRADGWAGLLHPGQSVGWKVSDTTSGECTLGAIELHPDTTLRVLIYSDGSHT